MSRPKEVVTTLAERGVSVAADLTATMNTELTIRRWRTPVATTFLAIPQRLMSGKMMAALVNSMSRINSELFREEGLVDDLILPINARGKNPSTEVLERDLKHRKSWFGPEYAEVGDYHAASWIQALDDTSRNTRLGDFYQSLSKKTVDQLVREALITDPQDDTKAPWLNVLDQYNFRSIAPARRQVLNQKVTAQLTPEEQQALVITRAHSIVVDFEKSKIYNTGPFYERDVQFQDGKLKFTEEQDPIISSGTFRADTSGGNIAWSIDDYALRLSDRARESGHHQLYPLLPVIAWRKTPDGERQYLTQRQARKFQGFPVNGDVLLGRTLASYYTPELPELWLERMSYEKGGPINSIMGIQALVLISLPHPNFGGVVLNADDGILAKLEAPFEKPDIRRN